MDREEHIEKYIFDMHEAYDSMYEVLIDGEYIDEVLEKEPNPEKKKNSKLLSK